MACLSSPLPTTAGSAPVQTYHPLCAPALENDNNGTSDIRWNPGPWMIWRCHFVPQIYFGPIWQGGGCCFGICYGRDNCPGSCDMWAKLHQGLSFDHSSNSLQSLVVVEGEDHKKSLVCNTPKASRGSPPHSGETMLSWANYWCKRSTAIHEKFFPTLWRVITDRPPFLPLFGDVIKCSAWLWILILGRYWRGWFQ